MRHKAFQATKPAACVAEAVAKDAGEEEADGQKAAKRGEVWIL